MKHDEWRKTPQKDIPTRRDHETFGGKFMPNEIKKGYTEERVAPLVSEFDWPMRYRGPW